MIPRITVLDILDHPSFGFNDDYRAVLRRPAVELTLLPGPDRDVIRSVRPDQTDGLIISGSVTSFNSGAAWIADIIDLLWSFRDDGRVPVLAICMTHELIAHLEGGVVRKNPRGSELGTVSVELTPEGARSALFRGFPGRFDVQSAHSHDVVRAPATVTVLARNGRSPCQALRLGNLWGVQFHPDITAATLRRWLRVHADPRDLIRQGIVRSESELADFVSTRIRDVPWRDRLFGNFVSLARETAAAAGQVAR